LNNHPEFCCGESCEFCSICNCDLCVEGRPFFSKKNIYFEESNYELYAYLNIKNKPNEILKNVI
jgi:hypothetical protein